MKTVIVGGVAGGASCAARLRRLDENAEIVLFEKGEHISFANCGLPYYIGGAIRQREKLLLQTPESFKARFGIDVRTGSEIIAVAPKEKTVTVKNRAGETCRESYDKLLLSPGSTPVVPPIPGIGLPGVFKLREIPDVDAVKAWLDGGERKRAVVCGGGFIGLEMAENLKQSGLEVELVELADQVMAPLDFEMAQFIHKKLREESVALHLGNGVKEFAQIGSSLEVRLKSGDAIETDIVIISLGAEPNTGFLEGSGIILNERNGIVTNRRMQTSDPDVYAVGDAAESPGFFDDAPAMIPLAGAANRQGRLAAGNMLGGGEPYCGTLGTSIVKVFDLCAAATGKSEKNLIGEGKKRGGDYGCVYTHPNSHAGYYPGASPLHLKLVYDTENGKILGAQAVGREGVDKWIDVIATAVRYGGTVTSLASLDLAYAPPFLSAKSPANFIGFAAENRIAGVTEDIAWNDLPAYLEKGYRPLDVRTEGEHKRGAIENSLLIPVDDLRSRIGELDKNTPYAVYCAVGVRGYLAVRILKQNGFSAVNLSGGWNTYSAAVST